jgi:hypothetical protein
MDNAAPFPPRSAPVSIHQQPRLNRATVQPYTTTTLTPRPAQRYRHGPPFHYCHDEIALLVRPFSPIMSVAAQIGRLRAVAGGDAKFLSSGIRQHPRFFPLNHTSHFRSYSPLRTSLGELDWETPISNADFSCRRLPPFPT